MSERPQIELEREAFRSAYDRPLTNPRHLWGGLIVGLVGAVLAAFAGWQIGGFWASLMPIPCAMFAGIAWAGLEPGFWFPSDRKDRT